jgi:hypothetical protein
MGCIFYVSPGQRHTLKPKGVNAMNTQTDDHLDDDAFEPIELGSVSEETRGGFNQGAEFAVGPNSRLIPIG